MIDYQAIKKDLIEVLDKHAIQEDVFLSSSVLAAGMTKLLSDLANTKTRFTVQGTNETYQDHEPSY